MIIVNLVGGIGNQMFGYAFGYAISKKYNQEVKLDINSFKNDNLREYTLESFNISLSIAKKVEVSQLKYIYESLLQKLYRKLIRMPMIYSDSYYKEKYFHFDEHVFIQAGDIYFDGYWQSEKYFLKFREKLLIEFILKDNLHIKCKKYEKDISSVSSISLHIRRGDYITNKHTNSVHGTCSLEYYHDAVIEIESKVEKPHFFIFSDDLVWAKENLHFIKDKTFIELDENTPDYEEMFLMSICQHNIIANSSFSWWGAWLNEYPNKIVIAPKKWFNDNSINTKDLIPNSWTRL